MDSGKIEAGAVFPQITAQDFAGGTMEIGKPAAGTDWKS